MDEPMDEPANEPANETANELMDEPERRRAAPGAGDHHRGCTAWLGALVVAWGAQAIVTQSLLLREALVLAAGSELVWGIVLGAWLLGVAAGAVLGGRLAASGAGRRRPEVWLAAALLALGAAGCLALWGFRGARGWPGIEPGEMLPLAALVAAALALVAPAGTLVGLAFPLACAVRGSRNHRHLTLGHVYALESAGSLAGGAVFSFWAVEHLAAIQVVLAAAAVTAAVAAGLLAVARPLRRGPQPGAGRRAPRRFAAVAAAAAPAVAALCAAAALVATAGGDDPLHQRLVERRWRQMAPGYELVAETESRYENLALGRRAQQYTLYADGQAVADFPDPYTFAPLAHFWLCQHPAPRVVLVLGGGAEGLLAEMLRHPVEHIDYVETDPRLLELLMPFLPAADRRALADPRVTVHHADPRYFVKTQRDRFDLVIVRSPEPTSALRARLYTEEFYGELRRAMTARAVLCLTAAAAPGDLSPAARAYLASIRATLRRHFRQVVIGWGDPAQVLAATAPGLLATTAGELEARYARRGIESERFDPAWFAGATDWLDAGKLARRAADLDAARAVPISSDLRPAVIMQRLVLWEMTTAPAGRGSRARAGGGRGGRRVIAWLWSLRLGQMVAALAVLGMLVLAAARVRHGARDGWRRGALAVSVGSTGLVTMALSIVWLFAFQNLYGYVYQRIGWIIALFMGGLVIGSLAAGRTGRGRAARGSGNRAPSAASSWRRLVAVDLLLALLALAVPLLLPRLGGLPSGAAVLRLVEWCVSLLVVATGLLGGAAFALAGGVQLVFDARRGAAAGNVVGADHAGASLGALACGVVLVPVFGITAAALLLAGMKVGSAVLLLVAARRRGAASRAA